MINENIIDLKHERLKYIIIDSNNFRYFYRALLKYY